MKLLDLANTRTGNAIQITLTASEADSLAAVLHEHVIMGEVWAGHGGTIRRTYPYLKELAEALCGPPDHRERQAVS
jgi:hypothetical protein